MKCQPYVTTWKISSSHFSKLQLNSAICSMVYEKRGFTHEMLCKVALGLKWAYLAPHVSYAAKWSTYPAKISCLKDDLLSQLGSMCWQDTERTENDLSIAQHRTQFTLLGNKKCADRQCTSRLVLPSLQHINKTWTLTPQRLARTVRATLNA